MRQSEVKAFALGSDAATLKECGHGAQRPRLTILVAQYVEDDHLVPAASVVLYGESVRELYAALREYYDGSGTADKETQ